MTPYPPPPPQPAAPGNDRTTLYGVLGIVGAICCVPLGILFGALAVRAARRGGKPATLGWIAIGLSVAALLLHVVLRVTGFYHVDGRTR